MASRQQLLETLADYEGFESVEDMLEHSVIDSVVPAICVKCGEYTDQLEPDQRSGYCEECQTHTVKSCLIIAGII